MKKAVLFLGLVISSISINSCTTDDFDSVDQTSLEVILNDDFNTSARDGEDDEENENSGTNDNTDPIIIIIKKD